MTWILDQSVVLTGSVNLTHNGVTNNAEHLVKLVTPVAVGRMVDDFGALWIRADPITDEYWEAQVETWQKLPEKKEAEKKERAQRGEQSRPRRK